MPEFPEVETIKNDLARMLPGERLRRHASLGKRCSSRPERSSSAL
jgi:formamidopyrimidine-DNA glycosylase